MSNATADSLILGNAEELILLSDAIKTEFQKRGGKPLHISCAHRWATVGSRGVVLETIVTPSGRATSREAIARFFTALTQRARGDSRPVLRSPTARRRALERADRELDRLGV